MARARPPFSLFSSSFSFPHEARKEKRERKEGRWAVVREGREGGGFLSSLSCYLVKYLSHGLAVTLGPADGQGGGGGGGGNQPSSSFLSLQSPLGRAKRSVGKEGRTRKREGIIPPSWIEKERAKRQECYLFSRGKEPQKKRRESGRPALFRESKWTKKVFLGPKIQQKKQG